MNCRLCGRELPDSRRARCNSCNTKIRRVRVKNAAITYLGGKCIRCGWDKHPAGLEFHHRDPNQKDFTIGMVANKSWDVIKPELDKCDLLCSCCHRIEHSNRTEQRWLDEAAKYNGRVLEFGWKPKTVKSRHCLECGKTIGVRSSRCRVCAGKMNALVGTGGVEPPSPVFQTSAKTASATSPCTRQPAAV